MQNRILLLGLGGILLGLVVILFLVVWGLSAYSRHNKEIDVPDFTGLSVPKAESLAADMQVRTLVVDTVFSRTMPRGSVVRQTPGAGSKVKKNRTVRLTINAMAPRNVPVPDVIDEPFKTAVSDLEKSGFELGKLSFVKDRATHRVLQQKYRNREIKAGALIPSGAVIDLVLGLSDEDSQVKVPCLIGMDYKTALRTVKMQYLNTGSIIFDRNIKTYQDSMAARVYYQNPDYLRQWVHPGKSVSMHLTLDQSRIPEILAEEDQEEFASAEMVNINQEPEAFGEIVED